MTCTQSISEIVGDAHESSARIIDSLLEWNAQSERQKSTLIERLSLFTAGLTELGTALQQKPNTDSLQELQELQMQLTHDTGCIQKDVEDLKRFQHELSGKVYSGVTWQAYLVYKLEHLAKSPEYENQECAESTHSSRRQEHTSHGADMLTRYQASVGERNIAAERLEEFDAICEGIDACQEVGASSCRSSAPTSSNPGKHRAALASALRKCEEDVATLEQALANSSLDLEVVEPPLASTESQTQRQKRGTQNLELAPHPSSGGESTSGVPSPRRQNVPACRDAHSIWANQLWARRNE